MEEQRNEFYVYVYIDPRNFEEFYYGKGSGSRKEAHKKDYQNDSEKSKRIKEIKGQGLEPIIKVIATNLSDKQALLVEKTLIWKLGKTLTNDSTGHYSQQFRKHNTMHLDLPKFDYRNGIYFVNVGEDIGKKLHRCWEDSRKFGFLAAGQHPRFSDPIRLLETGDVVAAYLKGHGYVGVGKVEEKAVKVKDFRVNEKKLNSLNLKEPNIFENSENELSEYLVKIKWIQTFDRQEAKWKANSGLYAKQPIRASLEAQPLTLTFLNEEFNVDLASLMDEG